MSWVWFLTGLFFVVLSVPLITRRVPPNGWYGFRTRKTLSAPGIWYEANHLGGIDLLIAGGLIVLTSAVTAALASRLSEEVIGAVNFAAFVLTLSWATVHSLLAIRRM